MINEENKHSKVKSSIKSKIIKRFGLLILIAFLVVLFLSRLAMQMYLTAVINRDFREEVEIVAAVFKEELLASVKDNTSKAVLESLKSSKRKSVTFGLDSTTDFFVETNGHLRAITNVEAISASDVANIKDYIAAGEIDKVIDMTRTIDGKTRDFRAMISPLKISQKDDRFHVYALIYVSVDDEYHLLRQVTLVIIIILALVFIITLIIMYLMAGRLVKPISRLNRYAKDLGDNLQVKPVSISTNDEVEELAISMNHMARDIQRANTEQVRFLQNASHELKTPLMSIRGYAEGILDGVMEDREEALGIIIDESDRLKKIVNQLSLLSKLETGVKTLNLKDINLEACINDANKRLIALARVRDVSINLFNSGGETPIISGDYDSLLQVFINLISNAIRYAKNEINIRVDVYDEDHEYLSVSIVDDGIGIREKMLPHIFERFYKGPKGQTGLGLAIVKAIIEQHNGLVKVYNTDEKGACFELILKKKSM